MKTNYTPKIFFVDDDQFCLTIYEKCIINQGFSDITTFLTAKELLKNISEGPDLVFSDYNLEDENGLIILKKIKAINPSIKVIIVSGHQDLEIINQSMYHGAYDYVVKGEFVISKITNIIYRWISEIELKPEFINKEVEIV